MAPPNPRADWERLGDRFYRKTRIYDGVFDEDLELENYVIAAAPYAGALGIASIAPSVPIRGIGWSDNEELLVVAEDGTVHRYFGLHGDFAPFSLGNGAEEYGVRACRFWSSGFVALLSNNQLIAVSNYKEPRPRLLASSPEGEVSSWNIIPPAYTLSRTVEVLLAVDKTLYVVDATEAEDRMLESGPFKHVAASPSGNAVALYTSDGRVWIVSSDFQNKYSEYDTKSKTAPITMEWCGDDAIVLGWEDEIHLVGSNGASSKHYYDGHVHVLPEFDGVWLLTNESCEFLHKISAVTEDVFRLGSTSPASVLLDSIDLLEKKSPKVDENMQRIRPSLPEAVDTCVRAAGQEFNTVWQKRLLKAASFGKSVLELYNSDEFVDTTERLRVLKAVRDFEIGMPISSEQYLRLTPERLLDRLINRHHYLLAIRMSEYIRLPTDKIYVHWASQKVKASTADDDSVCKLIVQRLEGKSGISFETIAQSAYDEGRAHLATQLLNHEPRAGKQVPLLLNMEEDSIALDKAMESGDPDLIYYVLLHLRKKLPLSTFFRTINDRPVAAALVEASARDGDVELLKDLYYQDDRPIDGSNILISEALSRDDVHTKIDKLGLAARVLTDAKDAATQFQQKSIFEATQLLRVQEGLDKELSDGPEYVGLSLNETVYRLIKSGYGKRAQRLYSDFKMTESTFWWIRLRALVAKRDWGELEEISKMRKSPIGWEPFYSEALGAGNTKVASTFVPKCTNLTVAERIEMWMKCGMIVKAGEEALRAKDLNTLEVLRTKASGAALGEIDRMINQLRPRR
uniref:Probable vacuolar protein sorting-associated protein 16 homolog n=1 Tax=Talaromyces marneffei PM1 TaxID=1077442 RepID=A0A093VGE7_TALMA